MAQSQSIKLYLGVPQTEKLPVYDVKSGNKVTATKIILTNTEETAAKMTITVNTIDVMKNIIVEGGDTKMFDVAIVLDPNDVLFVQQERKNAINVTISGIIEPIIYPQ